MVVKKGDHEGMEHKQKIVIVKNEHHPKNVVVIKHKCHEGY